jgi:hypothetical protein
MGCGGEVKRRHRFRTERGLRKRRGAALPAACQGSSGTEQVRKRQEAFDEPCAQVFGKERKCRKPSLAGGRHGLRWQSAAATPLSSERESNEPTEAAARAKAAWRCASRRSLRWFMEREMPLPGSRPSSFCRRLQGVHFQRDYGEGLLGLGARYQQRPFFILAD